MMLVNLKGEVVEMGISEYQGKSFPFCKVLARYGPKADLVRVSLAKVDGIKVGDKVDWVIEATLAENDRGKGRLAVKRSE